MMNFLIAAILAAGACGTPVVDHPDAGFTAPADTLLHGSGSVAPSPVETVPDAGVDATSDSGPDPLVRRVVGLPAGWTSVDVVGFGGAAAGLSGPGVAVHDVPRLPGRAVVDALDLGGYSWRSVNDLPPPYRTSWQGLDGPCPAGADTRSAGLALSGAPVVVVVPELMAGDDWSVGCQDVAYAALWFRDGDVVASPEEIATRDARGVFVVADTVAATQLVAAAALPDPVYTAVWVETPAGAVDPVPCGSPLPGAWRVGDSACFPAGAVGDLYGDGTLLE